jgi:protein-disulfide isomerase
MRRPDPASSRDGGPRKAGRPLRAALLLSSVLAMSCRPAETTQPGESQNASMRSDDADMLPAFEVESEGEPQIERFKVAIGDAPVRGPDNAPVTIVMFSDFECPFCERGHRTLEALQRKYGGAVRIVYKAYPLDMHSNAVLAAIAARTAQAQGKFWEFHDLLYGGAGLEVPQLLAYGRKVGVKVDALERDLDALAHASEVRRDMRQGRRLGVTSTPHFFINGRPLTGAQAFEAFDEIIAEELELAQSWLEAGVPAKTLYEHATKDGFAEVVYSRGRRGIDPDGVFQVPVGQSPQRGPATAPVTIVTFGDFECRFCVRGHHTMERLFARYGNELRLVYKHQPLAFHSHAFIAARASMAAHAQGKFWEFHDGLYGLDADFDEKALRALAKKVGLDMRKFNEAMNSVELDAQIETDLSLAMKLGVTGTPAYFINGRPLEGALPELQFRLLIEEELERAKAALREGVAPAQLYETLTQRPLD